MILTEKQSELIRKLPKAELHLHLQGAIHPEMAAELGRKNGVELPATDPKTGFYSYADLGEFLDIYNGISASVVTLDDFHRITYDMLKHAADHGARYVEYFISPHAHKGVPYDIQFDGMHKGMADAETDFGIVSAFIPGINRELGPAAGEEYLDKILELRTDKLVGLGLDYLEAPYPPGPFAKVYARAKRNGLKLCAHSGESGPVENIWVSLDELMVDRIDHGYNVIHDLKLVKRCIDQKIMYTVTPSSTAYTTPHRDMTASTHPIRKMNEAGMVLTINTDDPPFFQTNLTKEFEIALSDLGFSLADIRKSIINSIEHSWADETLKKTWLEEWTPEIDNIIKQLQPELEPSDN